MPAERIIMDATVVVDALEEAREAMQRADEHRAKAAANLDGGAYDRSLADREQKRALVLAQIAQAAALERIAEALEAYWS